MTERDRSAQPPARPAAPDWEVVGRVLSGEGTAAENALAQQWLAEHPADARLISALDKALSRPVAGAPAVDVERALRAVKAAGRPAAVVDLGTRRRARPGVTWWSSPALRAASLLVIAAGGWFVYARRPGGEQVAQGAPAVTYRTAVAERDSVRLSDGSEVVLGPLSRLEVSGSYGTGERSVSLEGEAVFRVQHDDARPFSVRVGGVQVRDIGTVFAVQSLAEGRVKVSVREGSVLLEKVSGEGRGVVLHRDDVGVAGPNELPVAQRGAGSDEDAAFASGRLVFREAPLTEVADGLHRWYGLTLRVESARFAARRVSATFTDDPPARVLSVLGLILGASVERQGDTVVVR